MDYDSEILKGKDDILFLTKSIHRILEHITGKINIPESSKVNFFENINSRASYCQRKEILYKHIIYPDKISVLSDYFPIKKITSFCELYEPFFTEDVFDLKECLKDGSPTKYFFKTDTHLSFEGKVKTSIEILKFFFEFNSKEIKNIFLSFKGAESTMLGDLGSKLTPPVNEKRFEIRASFLKRFNNQVGANDGLVIVCLNKEKLKKETYKRLLIFGDSFCERTLPFLAYFYSEVLFCRSRYFHKEIVDMYRPDHVITESAERYFSSVRSDIMAPRFNLVYGLKGAKYSENKEFYRVFNAILNRNTLQYKIYIKNFLKDY